MKRIVLIILGLGAMVVAFQNCGKAGFENQSVNMNDAASAGLDSKYASVTFPYDVSVNQIAHMSCALNVSSPTTNTPYFSWKVAAYANPSDVPTAALNIRSSGLQLKSEFVTAFNSMSSGYSGSAKAEYLKKILKTHPLVGASQLQLSFRDTSSTGTKLMQMPSGGNSPTSLLMSPLGNDGVLSSFGADPSLTYDYFKDVPDIIGRNLEGKLIVPSAYGTNNIALQSNYDSSYMVLGFQTSSASTNLSGSGDTKPYGKAYRVIFGAHNPHQGTSYYPTRDALVGINEYDAESKTPTSAGWDCSYRFKIVRPQDRMNTYYKTDNFVKIGGACPGQTLTGTYCASPVNSGFGLSNTFFPNATCPSNRPMYTGTYCVEKYATVCPPEPYNANSNSATPYDRTDGLYNPAYPNRARIFHALRRMLPTSEWDINVSRGCIVPKSDDNACYPSSNIVYDESFSSLQDANVSMGRNPGCGVDIAGVGGTNPCAAYLTLCIRR